MVLIGWYAFSPFTLESRLWTTVALYTLPFQIARMFDHHRNRALPTELETILRKAEELDIEPVLGVRSKLAYRGAGRWSQSGGDRSKFGLTTREIVEVVARAYEEHRTWS